MLLGIFFGWIFKENFFEYIKVLNDINGCLNLRIFEVEDEEVKLSELRLIWENMSEKLREAILQFDNGRVAFVLLKEMPHITVDDACEYANALVKIYKHQMRYSEEIH